MNRTTQGVSHDELHAELLVRNIFVITMVGAVAFVGACWWVLAQ